MNGLSWLGQVQSGPCTLDDQIVRLFRHDLIDGILWPDGATAVQFSNDAEVQPQAIEAALAFWE